MISREFWTNRGFMTHGAKICGGNEKASIPSSRQNKAVNADDFTIEDGTNCWPHGQGAIGLG